MQRIGNYFFKSIAISAATCCLYSAALAKPQITGVRPSVGANEPAASNDGSPFSPATTPAAPQAPAFPRGKILSVRPKLQAERTPPPTSLSLPKNNAESAPSTSGPQPTLAIRDEVQFEPRTKPQHAEKPLAEKQPQTPFQLAQQTGPPLAGQLASTALPSAPLTATKPVSNQSASNRGLSIRGEAPPIDSKPSDVPSILIHVQQQPVTLAECIRTSLLSRQVFNSISQTVGLELATSIDPIIADQFITTELSKFDPVASALLAGNHVDKPPDSFFGPGIQQSTRLDEGEFQARLSKLWPVGLTSSIGYEPSLAYLYFPLGDTTSFNPTHSSDMVFRLTQPLLRGGNRSSNLVNVRIAQQRSLQSRFQVEGAMQAQLRSIEQVYWVLHARHVRLIAVDQAIKLAWRTKEIVQTRFVAERSIYSDVARVTVKLEDLYQQRLAAEQDLAQASYQLSQLMGVPAASSLVLIPVDSPANATANVDVDALVGSAIVGNLELKRQKVEVDVRGDLARSLQNERLPQLDLQALHRTSGLEDDLGSAIQQMAGFEFNDYTLGLTYTQTLGARNAKSKIRAAQLVYSREAAVLNALEQKVQVDMLTVVNRLRASYSTFESALKQLSEAQKWVEIAQVRYEDPPLQEAGGESLLVLLVDYQTALQAKVDAIEKVADSIAEFNGLLAQIDELQGMMLSKWNIALTECQ